MSYPQHYVAFNLTHDIMKMSERHLVDNFTISMNKTEKYFLIAVLVVMSIIFIYHATHKASNSDYIQEACPQCDQY